MYQSKIDAKVNMAIATTPEKYKISKYTLWFILRITDNVHKQFYHPPLFLTHGVQLPEKSYLSNLNSIFLRNSQFHSPAVFFNGVSFTDCKRM
jgi:hypothetical protein